MNSSWHSDSAISSSNTQTGSNYRKEEKIRSLPCEEIPVDQIKADASWNSRSGDLDIDGLAKNIDEMGLLEPLVVTKERDGYKLVAGFRRFAAIQKLGWTTVRATIVEADADKAQLINLAENIERKNLRLYDTMRVVYDLSERKGLKSIRIARDTGLKESRVDRMVRAWPRLAPSFKERWSRVREASWEPSETQIHNWSSLSHPEQNAEWSKWAGDGDLDDPGTPFDLDEEEKKKSKKSRGARQKVFVIRRMIATLQAKDTDISRAQIRALKWALGERGSL